MTAKPVPVRLYECEREEQLYTGHVQGHFVSLGVAGAQHKRTQRDAEEVSSDSSSSETEKRRAKKKPKKDDTPTQRPAVRRHLTLAAQIAALMSGKATEL